MSAAPDDSAQSARRRHPCMRTPVRTSDLARRVAGSIGGGGGRHPEVAASVLAVRGASGLESEAFARRAGVDLGVLRRAEAGAIARDQLPGPLRRMVPVAPVTAQTLSSSP